MRGILMINPPEYADFITHAGKFHADEVLATAILLHLHDCVKVARVLEVPKDTKALAYDIGKGAYDHHQKGKNGMRENGVFYSSAGLIWRDYGRDVLRNEGVPERLIDAVWELVDIRLIMGVDGHDNGMMPAEDMLYRPMDFSMMINMMNPCWDEPQNAEILDALFEKAVTQVACPVLEKTIERALSDEMARESVIEGVNAARGHIMVLDRYLPWRQIVTGKDAPKGAEDIWYVIFPSNRGGYNVQCIPVAPDSTNVRYPVPESWHGAEKSELQRLTGAADATFCHPNGFLMAADSLEGAVKIAEEAVRSNLSVSDGDLEEENAGPAFGEIVPVDGAAAVREGDGCLPYGLCHGTEW